MRTPVAFFIFNRPDATRATFEAIAKIRPERLYVVADGPRKTNPLDRDLCTRSRAVVENVDWPCAVRTNFSEQNLGCRGRMVSGLNWVFNEVEEAIILEDDCIPHESFFPYCETLLETYRFDTRIMMITGTNLSPDGSCRNSYHFSKYPHIWGWASWRRVWKNYDEDMSGLDTLLAEPGFRVGLSGAMEYRHWRDVFTKVKKRAVNTWDAQVSYLAFQQNLLTIVPSQNLITNIGFGPDATHTKVRTKLAARMAEGVTFPLTAPRFFFPDSVADARRKRVEKIGTLSVKAMIKAAIRILYERNIRQLY